MAFSNLPPQERAKMERQEAERAALRSPDSFERWKAKEAMANRALQEFGKALVKSAQHRRQ